MAAADYKLLSVSAVLVSKSVINCLAFSFPRFSSGPLYFLEPPLIFPPRALQAAVMYDVQDVSGERKTAKWAADWLVKSVTSPEFPLPPADCLMVVLDGGNLSLFDEVVAAFGAISVRVFAHWCCSHTASLLMKALSDVSGIGECIDNARTIVKFIRGHDQPLFLYGEFSSKALVMWVETRFGTNFLVMERIVEVCTQLRQMVADPRWPANRRALTAEGKAAHDKVCAAAAVRCVEAVIY